MADLHFWGINVPANKDIRADAAGDEYEDFATHVTNVALSANAKQGRHTVVMKTGGQAFALGTLEPGRVMAFPVDTVLPEDAVFCHSGSGVVSITGYRTLNVSDGEEGEEGQGFGSEEEGSELEEEEEEEEESEGEEAPQAVPIDSAWPKKGVKNMPMANGKATRLADEMDEDDDSEDDMDHSSDDLEASEDSEDSEDGEDNDDSEDSELEAFTRQGPKKRNSDTIQGGTQAKKQRVIPIAREKVGSTLMSGKGNKAPETKGQGGSSASKAKTPKKQTEKVQNATPGRKGQETQGPTPAKATLAGTTGQGTPKEQEAFKKTVVGALKASGPLSLELLGGKVSPKPKFVKKLGKFLAQYPDTFVLEGGAVKLK